MFRLATCVELLLTEIRAKMAGEYHCLLCLHGACFKYPKIFSQPASTEDRRSSLAAGARVLVLGNELGENEQNETVTVQQARQRVNCETMRSNYSKMNAGGCLVSE